MTGGRPRLAVFLFPAVVGGGLGDIDEVLVAGAWLRRAGHPIFLYRVKGRPLPRNVLGPWRWPDHRTVRRLPPGFSHAITIAPAWGVSAAPGRAGRWGRAGVWAEEARAIEQRFGRAQTLHVSLEEFARQLTSAEENVERYREGGWTRRRIDRYRKRGPWRQEVRVMHAAYRRFRAFDRSNLLHLYGAFRPSSAFRREYPEAVPTGPLWPLPGSQSSPRRIEVRGRALRWCWYASPSTSSLLVPGIIRGFAQANRRGVVEVGTSRALNLPRNPWVRWVVMAPRAPDRWERTFRSADLRIVTGSRTLIEAVRCERPWLYFNGAMGAGSHRRRHRPEKIDNLLAGWPHGRGSGALRRDLRDFARARRVSEVVAAFARNPKRFAPLYHARPPSPRAGMPMDQGQFLVDTVSRWLEEGGPSWRLVRSVRADS